MNHRVAGLEEKIGPGHSIYYRCRKIQCVNHCEFYIEYVPGTKKIHAIGCECVKLNWGHPVPNSGSDCYLYEFAHGNKVYYKCEAHQCKQGCVIQVTFTDGHYNTVEKVVCHCGFVPFPE